MDAATPSNRLIDQRLRNRIMEAILGLIDGDEGVDQVGATEWFEIFFDEFPYDGAPPRDNSAIDDGEWAALAPLVTAMQAACRDTPARMSNAELKASGWPQRIAPIARQALRAFQARGRFSEEVEEQAPSLAKPWP